MFYQEETLEQTQDMLERFGHLAGLGAPQCFPRLGRLSSTWLISEARVYLSYKTWIGYSAAEPQILQWR